MKRLPRRREHLGIFFNSYAPLEDGPNLPHRPSKKADSDISTFGLCSTHDQANNLALCNVEIRVIDRIYRKVHQMSWQEKIWINMVF